MACRPAHFLNPCFIALGVWASGKGLPDPREAGRRYITHVQSPCKALRVTNSFLYPRRDGILTTSPGHRRALLAKNCYYYYDPGQTELLGLIGRVPGPGWGVRKGLLRSHTFGKSVSKNELELFPSPLTLPL